VNLVFNKALRVGKRGKRDVYPPRLIEALEFERQAHPIGKKILSSGERVGQKLEAEIDLVRRDERGVVTETGPDSLERPA
jgi:hypothetical protein